MRRELWMQYGDVPLTSLFLCWITGGHDWRYHLEKPYRMCRGCGVKEMRIDEADRQLVRLVRLSDAPSGEGERDG